MTMTVNLGEYIRRLRRRKQWCLQELANATGLSISHLSRIENDNAVPNTDTVVKLAKALDGDWDQMLELADCLPRDILERYVRRAGDRTNAAHRPAVSDTVDTDFPRALVDSMDPGIRQVLANQYGLSDQDVDGLFAVLERLARMSPDERKTILAFLSARFGAGGD